MERKHRTSLNDSGACRRSSWWLDILQIQVLLLPYIFWVLKPAIQIAYIVSLTVTLFVGQKGVFLTYVVSYVSVSQDVLFWPITPISDGQSGEQCEILHPGMPNWDVLTTVSRGLSKLPTISSFWVPKPCWRSGVLVITFGLIIGKLLSVGVAFPCLFVRHTMEHYWDLRWHQSKNLAPFLVIYHWYVQIPHIIWVTAPIHKFPDQTKTNTVIHRWCVCLQRIPTHKKKETKFHQKQNPGILASWHRS